MAKPSEIVVRVPLLRQPGEPLVMQEVIVAPPGPGEVRVRMVASGVCHSCLHAADGSHGGLPLPIILGDEGAGIVESVGPGCRELQVGDPIVVSWAPSCGRCRFCLTGRPVLCINGAPIGFMTDGTTRFSTVDGEPVHHFGPATYSPYTVLDESAAIKINPAIPLDRAALIGCSVATGVGAVVNTANARLGTSVAVFGCGGVGLNAIQGAALVGAHPIVAVDLVPARLELAEKLGATHTVNGAGSTVADQLAELASDGFDVTVVAAGSTAALEQAWGATGRGGICVVVGVPPDGAHIEFDPQSLRGERRLAGSVYGSVRPEVDFPKFADLYLSGRLKLDELITTRYGLDEANAAFTALARGDNARAVIVFEE